MAQGNNFASMLQAFYKNGQYVSFPFFQDVSIKNIITTRYLQFPDVNGNLQQCFQFYVQNMKRLDDPDIYYVTANSSFYTNLLGIQSYLNSQNAGNSFTLYTGLLEFPVPFNPTAQPVGDFNGYIVLNDDWEQERKYNPNDNTTTITTNFQQGLQYLGIKVAGDQTSAGSDYYDYYLAYYK